MENLKQNLKQKIELKDYTLPVLPDIAMKVVNLSSSEEVDFTQLTKLIQQDQTIASQVLRIANSPIYSISSSTIISIQQAIARLGTKNISEIALTITLQNGIFSSSLMRHFAQNLWKHSLATALWCKLIAFSKKQSVEAMYITGLLHEIGKPIILKMVIDLAKKNNVVPKDEEVTEILEELSPSMTNHLMIEWQLPKIITSIIEQYDKSTFTEYVFECNVLKLSNNLATELIKGEMKVEELLKLDYWKSLNIYSDEAKAILEKADGIKETISGLVV
jgi:HD-like signal output (HDOD) protein